MNQYLRLTFIFIGIWIVASIINGVLCVLAFSILSSDSNIEMIVCIPVSFLFSIPFVGLTWLVAMNALSSQKQPDNFYRVILNTSFILGLCGAGFFVLIFRYFKGASDIAIPAIIIVSAVSSIMVFRTKLKAIK